MDNREHSRQRPIFWAGVPGALFASTSEFDICRGKERSGAGLWRAQGRVEDLGVPRLRSLAVVGFERFIADGARNGDVRKRSGSEPVLRKAVLLAAVWLPDHETMMVSTQAAWR